MSDDAADWERWSAMSAEDRYWELRRWNAYAGDGSAIVERAAAELAVALRGSPGVTGVDASINHGGTYVLTVLVTAGDVEGLPREFAGFPVKSFTMPEAGK